MQLIASRYKLAANNKKASRVMEPNLGDSRMEDDCDLPRRWPKMEIPRDQTYWTRQREELATWISDRAPPFLDGYVGALTLLHMPPFPARINFICHAIRDIYRLLPASLGLKPLPRPSEVLPGMVKKLYESWSKSTGLQTSAPTPSSKQRALCQTKGAMNSRCTGSASIF